MDVNMNRENEREFFVAALLMVSLVICYFLIPMLAFTIENPRDTSCDFATVKIVQQNRAKEIAGFDAAVKREIRARHLAKAGI